MHESFRVWGQNGLNLTAFKCHMVWSEKEKQVSWEANKSLEKRKKTETKGQESL